MSRRESFLTIWQSIRRVTTQNREPYFTDVPKGAPGEDEITYAKYRGLVDDPSSGSGQASRFYPDEPLHLTDALL